MPTLRQDIQAALDENAGVIPFDAFMGLALHHPQDGYYTRNIRAVGRSGDFTTVAQRTPVLGEAIGRWLRDEASRRGWRRINVIECGPGSGSLAAAVLRSFGWLGKRLVSLHLVETSQGLREHQQARVRARWHRTIGEALAACGGRALIYHNEFLDAFPCRVFRRENDGWSELHLQVADGRLQERFLPPSRPRPASAALSRGWPTGQRIEVFESVRRWLHGVAPSWKSGAMLAIDYGGPADEIYHRRPGGTLRAYRGHERLTGSTVFDLPGRQDITADVNFDDLTLWTRELGWVARAPRTLAEFVAPPDPAGELADPAGAGGAFKVIELSPPPQTASA